MSWRDDVRRANETLDWIEARQGPLKPGGYARIETDVRTVRAMAEQDDAQVQEIRARLEAATPGPWLTLKRAPDLGATEIGAQLDTPDARVIADTELWGRKPTEQNVQDAAFIAHAREDVPYLLARLDALTTERDALRARAERAESALDGWQRLAERLAWHLSDQLHIAHFRFNAGGYGPASSYGDDGEQALADFRALMPDGMTVPRDYEGMKNRD